MLPDIQPGNTKILYFFNCLLDGMHTIILFFVFLLIAIPISVSLGLVAVLPGVFDPSFTSSASYVIRSMFG